MIPLFVLSWNLLAQAGTAPQTHAPTALPVQVGSLVPPAKPAASKVFVTVNGSPILASDIEPYLWDWKADEVANEMVTYRLIQLESDKKGITVTDAEVRARLQDGLTKLQESLPKGKTLTESLKEQGGSISRYAIATRSSIELDKLAELEFKPDDFVKVSTILIPVKSQSALDVTEAGKQAAAAYQSLVKGDNWSKVLQTVQSDPRIIQSQGQLGWRQKTAFPTLTQSELPNLKVGQFSKPVQTNYGFQIFRVDAFGKDAPEKDRVDLKAQFLSSSRTSILARLRSSAKIEKTTG